MKKVLKQTIHGCFEALCMGREMARLFCMQLVLHADMLFLQRSAILYPAEHFCENGRHFPFNKIDEWAKFNTKDVFSFINF
jgi:hypothetical protein